MHRISGSEKNCWEKRPNTSASPEKKILELEGNKVIMNPLISLVRTPRLVEIRHLLYTLKLIGNLATLRWPSEEQSLRQRVRMNEVYWGADLRRYLKLNEGCRKGKKPSKDKSQVSLNLLLIHDGAGAVSTLQNWSQLRQSSWSFVSISHWMWAT